MEGGHYIVSSLELYTVGHSIQMSSNFRKYFQCSMFLSTETLVLCKKKKKRKENTSVTQKKKAWVRHTEILYILLLEAFWLAMFKTLLTGSITTLLARIQNHKSLVSIRS